MRNTSEMYVSGKMFVDGDQDWDYIASGIKFFTSSRHMRCIFERAEYDDTGRLYLPFVLFTNKEAYRRIPSDSDQPRKRLDPKEAKGRVMTEARELFEDFFKYEVELSELDVDFSHPEELKRITSLTQAQRSFPFAPPRIVSADTLCPEKRRGIENQPSPLDELDQLIGLSSVKKQVHEIAALVNRFGKDRLPCLHMVFRGNPGTGKTTVARIIGRIFDEAGITSGEGVFVETDRSGLVAKYVGHTAIKTKSAIDKALGGILFIDEAYALALYEEDTGKDFGREAVATLVKELEDKRDEFICIMAGYPREMDQLADMNPGLRDRIGFYIDFPDYDAAELCEVFKHFAAQDEFMLSEAAERALMNNLQILVECKEKNFSNARIVRKIYERARMRHLLRDDTISISKACIEEIFEDNDLRKLVEIKKNNPVGFC